MEFYDQIINAILSVCSGLAIFFSLILIKQRWANTLHHLMTYLLLPPISFVITQMIADNFALSLGMIGALSIVRFRTPIKEPEELVYLFLVIAAGLGCGANQLKITILGAGSNTLIRDNVVKGVVIKLGKGFAKINLVKDCIIEVGAAALDRKISNFAAENNVGNLEFLACIPGTIGGAVIMNSGCYNNDISKVLISITVINLNNLEEREIKRDDIKFFYRGSDLPQDFIISSVKLKGQIMPREIIEKKQSELIERKKLSQPSKIKTCGSTFKNINDKKKLGNF